jgi:hypothetical protein
MVFTSLSGKTPNTLWRATLLAGLMLAISACATAPTTISNVAPPGASTENGDAVLVVAIGYIATRGQYNFRRVDLNSGQFRTEVIPITFAIWSDSDVMRAESNERRAAVADPGSNIVLLVRQLPAGDYAITGMGWNTYASNTMNGCFKNGAVVVRLAPGSISFVNSGNVVPPGAAGRLPANIDPARIREAFENARASYPALQGEPVEAEVVRRIRWTDDNGCHSDAETFVTVQGNDDEVAAARTAAIEAARQNLAPQPAPKPAVTPNR